KEALSKAVERARRDRDWVGVAQLYVPTVGTELTVSFRPAVREQRVVGVLLSTFAVDEGEPITTEESVVAPPPRHGRLVGLEAKANRMMLLSTQEIRFAEADGSDVWLHTDHGRLRAPERGLGLLEERLRTQEFLRVHRHFLVNLRRVKEIAPNFKGCFWLVLDGPGRQLIPVSRRRTAEVRRCLGLSWNRREDPA
ncbi:MAG: LytTR family DNA-binding domain-containing protein, partial [Acidimicrobiia bacterium]